MSRRPALPALGAALALAAVVGAGAGPGAARADDWELEPTHEEDRPGRLSLTAWGGEQFNTGTNRRASGAAFGGEAAWAFDQLEVGAWAAGYRNVRDATRSVTPVLLLRLNERFETRRGLEAGVSLGLGAAQPNTWKAWFQLGINARLSLGPMFLAGELAFEQYDIVRISGGIGVRL